MNKRQLPDKAALAAMIDHTNLKPYATKEDMEKLCQEAKDNGFAMVAINSAQTKRCHELLKDTPVHVGAAISFPLGQTTTLVKLKETLAAIKDGADEIDYVANLGDVKDKNWDAVEKEMKEITELCHQNNIICKVIFENCYLEPEEIDELSRIAKKVRPDFIKTSTGFGTYGARVEDVKRMKDIVGDDVKVKAAGGIRSLEDALDMIEAGAERLGTSAGLKIMKEYDEAVHQ